jgi:TolA-binding protein
VVYGYSYPKWQAEAAYEAARCLESLDQKPQAVSMYQELVDKFPKSDKAVVAKKRLAELHGKK